MTLLREQLFAEAFSELVARASSEPFVELIAIGQCPEVSFDVQLRLLAEPVEVDSRGLRFADLESSIVSKERALRLSR